MSRIHSKFPLTRTRDKELRHTLSGAMKLLVNNDNTEITGELSLKGPRR